MSEIETFNLFCLNCARFFIDCYHSEHFQKSDYIVFDYIRDKVNELKSKVKVIDFQSMTKEQLTKLGFREVMDGTMMAMPPWVWDFVKEGTEVFKWGTEPLPFSKNLDNDERNGLTCFTIIIKDCSNT